MTQRHETPIIVDSETREKIEQIKNKIGEVDHIYCSPLQRVKETADLIFGEGKYEVLDFIYEYETPNVMIGKSRKAAIDYWELKHKNSG